MLDLCHIIRAKRDFQLCVTAVLRWELLLVAINPEGNFKIFHILQAVENIDEQPSRDVELGIALPESVHAL